MRWGVLAVSLLLAGSAQAATYYASPTGSGSTCSLSSPCSLSGAQTVVRAAIAGGMTEDATVYVRSGAYRIAAPLAFIAADSGVSGHTVHWRAYPQEAAIISGCETITGWTATGGGIFQADVTAGRNFRQLYVNGTHAQRARGADNPTGWTRTPTGYTAPDASMNTWANPRDIEIVSLGLWSIDRLKVDYFGTSSTVTINLPGPSVSPLTGSYELGVMFTVDSTTTATELGYWRVGNGPSVTGHLWNITSGTLLATVTHPAYSGGSAEWQFTNLSSPIALTTGITYATSYDSSSTAWPYHTGAFPVGIDNPPIHVAAGASGIISLTPGSVPDSPTTNYYYSDVGVSSGSGGTGPTVTMQTPGWTNQTLVYTSWGVSATPSHVENAYELLDTAGEWYLNRATHTLYYMPAGGSMTGLTVEAPIASKLITVTSAAYLDFEDLTLDCSNWTGPDSGTGYVGIQAGEYVLDYGASSWETQPAALDVVSSSHVMLRNNRIKHMGSRALMISGGSSTVSLIGNTFEENASGAMQLGLMGTCPATRDDSLTVTGNRVLRGNAFDYTDPPGIHAPCISNSTIANNAIYDSTWAGVQLGSGWSTTPHSIGNAVARNYINGFCRQYVDCGAFYTNSPQSGSASYATGLSLTGNVAIGTVFHAYVRPYYSDDYSSWETISGNVCSAATTVWGQASTTADHLIITGNRVSQTDYYPVGEKTDLTMSDNTSIGAALPAYGTEARAIMCASGDGCATPCAEDMWQTWNCDNDIGGKGYWHP